METLIKSILAQPKLQDNLKSAAIAKLLTSTASLSKPDASFLLDLGLDLKSNAKNALEVQAGDRILLAVSIAHRDLFWARFANDWFETQVSTTVTNLDYVRNVPLFIALVKRKEGSALTEEDKQVVAQDMEILQRFAEKSCIKANPPLEHSIQCIFVSLFVALPATRPLTTSDYIEFLVDHLAVMPSQSDGVPLSKNAISLLKQCWENGTDNIFITISQLFVNLSNDQQECSIGIGHLLQAIPETYTYVVDPFIQSLDSMVLWRLRFTVQRLINWLVTIDIPGIGIWIVAIIESLASRGEFNMLRELTDENAYKIARQFTFKQRRNDAILVLKPMLLGYYHSPTLFNNISNGLLPLLMSCRKSPEDIAFATEVCNLAQTLVIHFGYTDVGTKVQKARAFLNLPIVTRPEALKIMNEFSWKKGLQIQNTSAGFRRKPAFAQPLGKVGLVNLGNSCFMNSALRALFCSVDFKQAILNDTLKVPTSKIITTKLRETFDGLVTPRLSIFKPSTLYRALPEWLNDGHQQDAAEFTKILFSRLEDEDPASKKTLSSFHGVMVNQVKCDNCGTVSSNKEEFYDLTIPLPRSEYPDLQTIVDVFPSVEELNDENNNKYFCDHCQSLQSAKRHTMLTTLPTNLIISLNRFEFDVQRSRRIKINTPIQLSESIQIKIQDGHELQIYNLYAVVVHTGESANHGHYYTYAKDSIPPEGKSPDDEQWLLYNDTSVTISSFEAMKQALASSRADTPYMLFFRKAEKLEGKRLRSKRSISNL
ncbi:Ubiquitin carboxyl-terminal hydrolase 35 [Haplosporangium sp. Z 27]|nr:Ubiquitin carboxyl-terminal hydrolase 35 [Haplosporangium sp. Z 27]